MLSFVITFPSHTIKLSTGGAISSWFLLAELVLADFVKELTTLFNNYGTASSIECIALKAAMVMPVL